MNYHQLKAFRFEDIEQAYSFKDCMLYALSIGIGGEPTDARQLRYVYEDGLIAVPTMAAVLSYPGFWQRDPRAGIDWLKSLHGEQDVQFLRPIPPQGRVIARSRIVRVVDKGASVGALVALERRLRDAATGEELAVVESTNICRGDGGFGQGDPAPPRRPATPEREPDRVWDFATQPQAALLYRLSGDFNPLHADPAVARAANFERPILHGLATYGIAGHAILRHWCDYQPQRLRSLGMRFAGVVYPGETLRIEMWDDSSSVRFRAWALERNTIVLSHGTAQLH